MIVPAAIACTIKRPKRFVGFAVKLDVELDGRKVALLKNGENTELQLEPGQHTLLVRSWQRTSEVLELDIQPGDRIVVEGGFTMQDELTAPCFIPIAVIIPAILILKAIEHMPG